MDGAWRGQGKMRRRHNLYCITPVSFLLTVAHPLSTNLFLSPAICCQKKIKDRGFKFHQENTEHSLAKIRPALQARTMRKIPYQSKRTGPNREKKKYKMWKNYLPEHVLTIVNSWPYWFNGLNSIHTGLDAAQLTPSRDNQEKGLESGGFCESISFASEVSGLLWQFSNFYYWTNADGL